MHKSKSIKTFLLLHSWPSTSAPRSSWFKPCIVTRPTFLFVKCQIRTISSDRMHHSRSWNCLPSEMTVFVFLLVTRDARSRYLFWRMGEVLWAKGRCWARTSSGRSLSNFQSVSYHFGQYHSHNWPLNHIFDKARCPRTIQKRRKQSKIYQHKHISEY